MPNLLCKGSLKTFLDAVLAPLKLASLVFRLPLFCLHQQAACPARPLLAQNLRCNRAIGNLVVVGKQHGFGQHHGERVVALKRDKQLIGNVFFAAVWHDAKVLVIG